MDKLYFPSAVWCDIMILESDGRFAMIDTGTAGHFPRIAQTLRSIGAERLDFILITHYHKDHYGSCVQLVREFPTGAVWVKPYSSLDSTDGDGQFTTVASRSETWAEYQSFLDDIRASCPLVMITPETPDPVLGDIRLRIYNKENTISDIFNDPQSGYYHIYEFNENLNSVIVYLENSAGCSAFLTGDAADIFLPSYPSGERLVERAAQDVGHRVDVYKVPHHGCGDHTSGVTVGILRPDYAVITCTGCDEATLGRLHAANPELETLYCVDRTHVFTLTAPGRVGHSEL